MDNDYQEGYYFVNDLDALRVTAAHEFNHAIQLSYGVHWDDQNPIDLYFIEMTSTWVEDVVYNDINRYLEYLPILFENFSNNGNQ